MKQLPKQLLLAAAATSMAAGSAMAEGTGTRADARTDTRTSYGADYNTGVTGNNTARTDMNVNTQAGVDAQANGDKRAYGYTSSDGRTVIQTPADRQAYMNSRTHTAMDLSSRDIQRVQQRLNDRGYSLSVDGMWGPRTSAAVRSFQQDNGLEANGRLDSRTMAEMDLDGSVYRNQGRY